MAASALSDKALSVFAFAAYHSLVSGELVRRVVLDDHEGHHAASDGVKELEEAGLLTEEGERGAFTPEGEKMLQEFLATLRRSVR